MDFRKLPAGERRLWVALVAVLVVAIGAYTVGPAIGASLTVKKAKKLFLTQAIADGLYLTKAEGDNFLRQSAASNFLPAAAGDDFIDDNQAIDARFAFDPGEWFNGSTSQTAAQNSSGSVTFSATGAITNRVAVMTLELPFELGGRTVSIDSVDYCYATTSNSTLNAMQLRLVDHTPANPLGGSANNLATDQTDRTDDNCATLTDPAPTAIPATERVQLTATIDYSAAGSIDLSRVTANVRLGPAP
jgi:hypothetical protein